MEKAIYSNFSWNIGTPNADSVVATLVDSTLAISGSGAMQNFLDIYSGYGKPNIPWKKVKTNVKKLVILPGITSIGEYIFSGCDQLTEIIIPDTIASIGAAAFSDCTQLTQFTVPRSVTKMGYDVFLNCHKLTKIVVDPNNAHYSSNDGILYNKNQTTLISCPAGKKDKLTIANTVTTIEDFAFYSCHKLTGKLTIPTSVTHIGTAAFYNCTGLTGELIIADSVISINDKAFQSCVGLTAATIPQTITYVGEHAFADCFGLTVVNFNAINCTKMGSNAFPVFYNCTALTTLIIGANVTNIPKYAFMACANICTICVQSVIPPTIEYQEAFADMVKATCLIMVETDTIAAYRAAAIWNDFKNIRQHEDH